MGGSWAGVGVQGEHPAAATKKGSIRPQPPYEVRMESEEAANHKINLFFFF